MLDIFKGYKAITDSQFKQYISRDQWIWLRKQHYERASHKNKYKTLLRAGKWKTSDEDQKGVLALRAQIEDLKKKKDINCSTKMNWKKKAPSNPKATKIYKNWEYYWCPKHNMWTVQKSEDCKLLDHENEESKGNNDNCFANGW